MNNDKKLEKMRAEYLKFSKQQKVALPVKLALEKPAQAAGRKQAQLLRPPRRLEGRPYFGKLHAETGNTRQDLRGDEMGSGH